MFDHEPHLSPDAMAKLRAGLIDFGFSGVEHALSARLLSALQAEASAQRPGASAAVGNADNPYNSHIADLGDVARSFLTGGAVARFLETVFEQAFTMSDRASCYTYYGPGHFIGRHRDRPIECAVTLILYLDAASPDPQMANSGMSLRVFGEDGATAAEPSTVIPTRVGTLVVGRGSRSWHERQPLQRGERVAALTACFKAA